MTYLSTIDFIGLILICSTVCVGFYAACQFDGDEEYDSSPTSMKLQWPRPEPHNVMVFWWVRWYGGRLISRFWTKPIYSCLPCMGSLHSIIPTLLYLKYTHFYPTDFWFVWPVIALGTVGVNYLIQTVLWK